MTEKTQNNIRPLSEVLTDFSDSIKTETIRIENMLEAFHERGFGALIFIFALPAAVPLPGLGVNMIIALPLLVLTAQQMIGRHTIWLPKKTKARQISKTSLQNTIRRTMPWIKKLELLIRPRMEFITQGGFSILIGLLGFIMAISITIPLPLTNTVPAMGVALMGIGVFMRDGLAVIAGACIGMLWIGIIITVIIIFGTEGIDLLKETIKSVL